MDAIPAVPPDSLNAERGFQADQRWHRSAFAILPPPFGNLKLLDVGCGGGGVAARAAGMGWEVVDTMTLYKARSGKGREFTTGKRREAMFADRFVWLLAKKS